MRLFNPDVFYLYLDKILRNFEEFLLLACQCVSLLFASSIAQTTLLICVPFGMTRDIFRIP
jgi:hypothetical protein